MLTFQICQVDTNISELYTILCVYVCVAWTPPAHLPAVVSPHPPHTDAYDGLGVEHRLAQRVDQLQRLVLQHQQHVFTLDRPRGATKTRLSHKVRLQQCTPSRAQYTDICITHWLFHTVNVWQPFQHLNPLFRDKEHIITQHPISVSLNSFLELSQCQTLHTCYTVILMRNTWHLNKKGQWLKHLSPCYQRVPFKVI